MKRWMIIILLFALSVLPISANTRKTVELAKCTDGDTAHFLIDGKDTTVRFLAIDTPEYTKEKEPYGKEASEFTCNALKEADVIALEYDEGSDVSDKYGRDLAWVYVDNDLLQKQLVSEGLAEVAYIYGDYAYTDELYEAQEQAKKAGLGIWSGEQAQKTSYLVYIATFIGVIVIVLLSLSNQKGKKRKIRQVKKVIRKINEQ